MKLLYDGVDLINKNPLNWDSKTLKSEIKA
jgi:hypothetical protein